MLYIPCSQCGFNNPVKSETILFCEKCSKKLLNNYIDWHKQHPSKTFDDFAKIYCITEFDIAAKNTPVKKKNIPKILAIVLVSIVTLLLLLGLAGYYIGKKYLDNTLSTTTSKTILTEKWTAKTIGTSKLTLQLPFDLDKQPVPLADTVTNKINTLESYGHVSDKGFKVVTYYADYKPGIEANLDAAVMGAVAEVQKLPGVSDFRWNRTDTVVGNKNAAFVNIQYSLLTYSIRINALIVCNKNCMWNVVTQFSADDASGKEAADRILASVEIKKE